MPKANEWLEGEKQKSTKLMKLFKSIQSKCNKLSMGGPKNRYFDTASLHIILAIGYGCTRSDS